MKPDTRNIAATLLLIASSLGIGRTGFAWHERLEEQAVHITELEDEILQARDVNATLEHTLDVVQQRAALSDTEPSTVSIASNDDRAASDDSPVATVPEASDIDVAFLQSTMAQIQLLQDQQNTVITPEPAPKTSTKSPTKKTTDTPKKRSRTTRAS